MPRTRSKAFCSEGRVHQLYASSRILSRVGVAQPRAATAHSSNTQNRCKWQHRLRALGVVCGDMVLDRSYRVCTNFGCSRNPTTRPGKACQRKSLAGKRKLPKIFPGKHSKKD